MNSPDLADSRPTNGSPSKADILIVDDIPDNLRLLSRMLVRRGYEIITARTGAEALSYLEEAVPELILLDVNMPGMDGYEVCRHIKADSRLEGIPVIFLSALSEPSDKLRGFEVGGVDYVTKPFHFHEVIARVETHLELYRQKRENERLRELEKAGFNRINHLKDRVLNTATHDLKNPLTSIKLSVSLLRKLIADPEPKVARYLTKIEFDTDRMLQLITDLLDVATVEISGPIQPKAVQVNHFLQRAINDLSDPIHRTGIRFALRPADDDLRAYFDPDQIGHVLRNLLRNLIKYTPAEGQVIVAYKVEEETRLVIRAFHPPQPGETPIVADGNDLRNLDLGIALLQVIAEQHGGEIRRFKDEGFDFELILPYEGAENGSSFS